MLSLVKQALKRTAFYKMYSDQLQSRSLRRWTSQDDKMRSFYGRFIRPGDLCIDVGANVGTRVKVFLKLGATVVAVEPQHQCVRILTRVFGRHPGLTVIPKALGERAGSGIMKISNAHTLSSLSPDWIRAVTSSGRFPPSDYRWDVEESVKMTTLDSIIESHGEPSFIKIDVEGYEFEVLKGLTRPTRALSFEFTPEALPRTCQCISHLASLGTTKWNYSVANSMALSLDEWVTADRLTELLSRYRGNEFGDIYMEFPR